jgi:hypothetical protein
MGGPGTGGEGMNSRWTNKKIRRRGDGMNGIGGIRNEPRMALIG